MLQFHTSFNALETFSNLYNYIFLSNLDVIGFVALYFLNAQSCQVLSHSVFTAMRQWTKNKILKCSV